MLKVTGFALTAFFIVLGSEQAKSDVTIQAELFVFDDTVTQEDFKGFSPLGSVAIKYTHPVTKDMKVYIGLKHESSIPYREIGGGFDGIVLGSELRVF